MDADYAFKNKCEESAKEAWQNEIERIKKADGTQYWEDRLNEASDDSIPIYTKDLWDLVEYLDECWDEAKESETLDKALIYAVYIKASEYHYAAWEELGGEDRLNELEEVWGNYKASLDECDITTCQGIEKEFSEELKELGIEVLDIKDLPKQQLKP